ncbi:hypothetical protein BLNAU_16685 [Blattamonas nauphoetae]|uniref:TLDc domain-containing protein n=1 Tax=Blattamonas nauphoetae TaxID=2049346 RepID=A0ABQ9XBU4_9EUKA|nr:hypothetical protein BLNAU_16685 [Blattamonas nauphoetae]
MPTDLTVNHEVNALTGTSPSADITNSSSVALLSHSLILLPFLHKFGVAARRSGSCHAQTESLLRGLDAFCTGLAEFISKEKMRQDNEKQTERISENQDKSEISLLTRSSSALSLIESTLGEMLTELQRQKQPVELDRPGKELRKEVAGFLIEHFPHIIVPRSSKQEGVIELDLARERQKMEEQLQMQMREMEEKNRLREMEFEKKMEAERQKIEAELKKLDAEREKLESERLREKEEIAQTMHDLKAELDKNQQLIEQGRKWAEQERKRQEEELRRRRTKIGATAIEFLDKTHWIISGNVFSKSQNTCDSLLSFEFGADVARLSLIIKNGPNPGFAVGIVSSDLSSEALTRYFPDLKGGAGWNLFSLTQNAKQNKKDTNYGSACLEGREGQRVVMEADGREGKRTLKLSKDGETQPIFFTNIPVPFRFVIQMLQTGASAEIVSSEVINEPQMVGGTTPIMIDE